VLRVLQAVERPAAGTERVRLEFESARSLGRASRHGQKRGNADAARCRHGEDQGGARERRGPAHRAGDEQRSRIGNQTGGRVFLFLKTDDFARDYEKIKSNGVNFVREPKIEEYGTVAVFEDLYGNLWDLVEFSNGK